VNDNIIDLNFCTQNVRSLNIASKNIITEQKIHAVTKNGCDIVFLSDLRLNSLKQIVACKEISQKFYFRGYKFIHNSPVSSRGVGILVKRTVLEKVSIVNTVRDTDGNYILIDIEYKNNRYTLGSVYGANTNEGISMYDALERDLVNLKNEKIILGGDWNATYDRSDVNVNIDIVSPRADLKVINS
jgi:exonuclease III